MKRSHSNSSSSKSTTTSSEIGISRKKIQENQLELGLKLQQSNRNRSFSSKDDQNHNHNHNHNHDDQANGGPISDVYNINISCCLNRDNNITTTTKSSESTINNINDANISNVSCIADCFLADNNNNKKTATAIVRGLQPFDVSSSYYYSAPNSFIKSSGEMATATMGYPFTVAQWKELERQAMIYKYMMASLPVPPDLLYSSFPANLSAASTFGPASYFMGKYGSGISVRWSGNNKDAEPGRCRRTDGKKWRCSRDVAPNQKYCERHMHRGRPRSRKHVEQQLLNQNHSNLSDLPINNNNNNKAKESLTKKTRLTDSVNTQSVRSCTIQPSKAAIYDQSMVSNANPFEDSRSLAWSDDQQWHQLMQSNVNTSVFQHQFAGEPLNLNSNAGLDCKTDLGLYERPLIDAWSIGDTKMKNHSSPLSGQSIAINEDMCQIHMGLGLIDSWVASTNTPGGPLAEVLGPGTASNQGMSDAGDGDFVTPPATAVSSPSGVLQKTLATFSDSSGNNSPICHHSRRNSDLPFHWLN